MLNTFIPYVNIFVLFIFYVIWTCTYIFSQRETLSVKSKLYLKLHVRKACVKGTYYSKYIKYVVYKFLNQEK